MKTIARIAATLLLTADGSVFADGGKMDKHTANSPLIAAIEEHVMVSGESHEGLWLGPNLLFRPGDPATDMHVFLGASDRRGGDSIQEQLYFTCPAAPRESAGFAEWRGQWQQQAYPEALAERVEDGYRFVPTFNWKFHAASGKGLGFGHVLRHRGKALSDHLAHVAIAYSVHDPATRTFAAWRSFRIEVDGEEKPCVAYGQRVDLPNGDILLPFSTIKELNGWNSMRWCGSARCRFDGETVEVIDVGNLVTHPVPRGFVEPSMAASGNRYFMTLRAQDGHSHVTVSEDGLTWADPIPWRWDDGKAIAMDQTMTKFISRPEGLFLVYTRITDDNSKVFRHRAPLFLAQVAPESVCLIRATESTLLANRGFPVGNFKVHEVSPRETWVTAPEWDRSGRDIPCDNRLARILWAEKPVAARGPADLTLGEPVVAAVSAPGEQRWGFHQFPNLSRLPDGRILLTWADARDASETHGQPAPAVVSADAGRTWQPFADAPRPTRPHYSISRVFEGEYLVLPSWPYLNIQEAGIDLPEPAASANVYGIVHSYRVADLPPTVQEYFGHIPARRWSPEPGEWREGVVDYDLNDRLAWKRDKSNVLPRTFFERPLLQHGGELLYADYRSRYALADGSVPAKGASHLMVSTDNGRTFRRRATIAADPDGQDLYGEPQLAHTVDGRLVCVLRKTDQQQKPMAITWSADDGRTWTPPQELCQFGVWPCVLLLGNGTLVLSYGRPGVHLRFDAAGGGRDWSEAVSLIAGDAGRVTEHTCGYTSLLALDAQSFLIAYSDFHHRDADGVQRKAILVRRVTVGNDASSR